MDWFADWFNSPYYHLLYRHRNDTEAQLFIDNLLAVLKPLPHTHVLDLACGKGRHARYMAQKMDWDVTGVDLSPESIAFAQQWASNKLHFAVHDMRQVFKANAFDYVFNFFTSFGYFDNNAENHQTIAAIHASLKPNGYLVIDFFNAHKVINNLVPAEQQIIEGVQFDITREMIGQHIVKTIRVTDAAKQFKQTFTERVQAITLEDFTDYLTQNGFAIHQVWGNYALRPFNLTTSDRLILVAQSIIDY